MCSNPHTNFYNYINKQWCSENQIRDGYSKMSSFDFVENEIDIKIKKILDENNCSDFNFSKIKILWNQGNDEKTINSLNLSQIIGFIVDKIQKIQNTKELNIIITQLNMMNIDVPIVYDSIVDFNDNTKYILSISNGNFGIGNNKYYLLDEDKIQKYKLFLKELLSYISTELNLQIDDIDYVVASIYKLEIELVKSTKMTYLPSRSLIHFNLMTFSELEKKYPSINWIDTFSILGLDTNKNICNQEPEYLSKYCELLNNINLDIWKYYLILTIILSNYECLTYDVYEICFKFYGEYLESKKSKPRWQIVIDTIFNCAGEVLWKKYCDIYFTDKENEIVTKMIKHVKEVFKEKVNIFNWMQHPTKNIAKNKIDNIKIIIGFEDNWNNYDELIVSENNNFFQNVIECYKFKIKNQINNCNNPDKKFFKIKCPCYVNSYYNCIKNTIFIPAAILNYPFFDINQPMALNYGSLGSIICHEILHSIDLNGSNFDKNGKLNNWWNYEDFIYYDNKTENMRKQYNNFLLENNLLEKIIVNDRLTCKENIADYMGVRISLDAFSEYLKLTNLSYNDNIKLFFESWSRTWRTIIKLEQEKKYLEEELHPHFYFRVNGILQNMEEFYEQYKITENDFMYLSPEKRTNFFN